MSSRGDRFNTPSRPRGHYRDRDRSRDGRSRDDPSRSRSRSPTSQRQLPHNASPISVSDYFQKSNEFRVWLKDEKGKYFDELSGEKSRSYFRKFVKAWNRGKLSSTLYAGIENSDLPATSQTSYKWSFTSKSTRADNAALEQIRESVGAATQNRPESSPSSSAAPNKGRMLGPTLPSASDMQLAKETAAEIREEERKHKRKRERMEGKERIEDMVGPKEVGREGMLEKKRMKRENDRTFREKGDEGLEADESTLMGGGDSFHAHIARRDAARQRHEQARNEKTGTAKERADAIKAKESATMAMFQEMAKQRFG
ncbi:hypothetical protein E1B28_001864 [Marasmius oreades]|uniref:Uncharacterized protein n=1 Tax=Marasmius oreades TaxID=181124 RepID=A0A9P7V4F9_9AGAR|nr:uncharacterized protein E1B28_001864 [Marasmius oreades]KAG7100081.1 hypothetical protein E1B28_001864 [Marasmius oreades]